MRIFVSYASEHRGVADRIALALREAGHTVFFDRDDLPPGRTYDDQIRTAIRRCSLFIFLISPEALTEGRYTLSELGFARTKWPSPKNHVLPVLVAETPHAMLPTYLASLTYLKPQGNLVADVAGAIERMRKTQRLGSILRGGAMAVLGLGAAFGAGYIIVKQAQDEAALARFAVSGATEGVIGIGRSATFSIVNETPAALPEYTCEVVAAESPIVAAVTADSQCASVQVALSPSPFTDATGAPMAPDADPVDIPVTVTLRDRRGRQISEVRHVVRAQNSIREGITLEGAPTRARVSESFEARAAYWGGELPAGFVCRAEENRNLRVESTGACAWRVSFRADAIGRDWLAAGNTQRVFFNVAIDDAQGRRFADHIAEIDVGN